MNLETRTEWTTPDGVKVVAKTAPPSRLMENNDDICEACVFYEDDDLCRASPNCFAWGRLDEQYIIWVKAE